MNQAWGESREPNEISNMIRIRNHVPHPSHREKAAFAGEKSERLVPVIPCERRDESFGLLT